PEVQVVQVTAIPPEVREGQPFLVEVVVSSNHDDQGFIDLRGRRGSIGDIGKVRRQIRKGETRFQFQHPPLVQENFALIRATARGFDDYLQDNNTASAVVFCSGKPRVLILDSDKKDSEPLARAPEEEGLQVDPPRNADGLP